jgi:iron complex transport system substrate-binding protein
VEAIIGMAPDLIVASNVNRSSGGGDPFKPLRNLGIDVVYIKTPESIAQIYDEIEQIAAALGLPDKAAALVAGMKARIDAVSMVAKTIKTKRSVYYEVSSDPYPVTMGGDTYLNEIINLVGAKNIFADQKGWFAPTTDAVIAANPDVILANAYSEEGGGKAAIKSIKNRPGFSSLDALKQNRLYLIDGNAASQASPVVVKAIGEIARAIYPEYSWPNDS